MAALPGVVLISIAVTIIMLGLFRISASGLPIPTLGCQSILVALVVCLLALQLAATPGGWSRRSRGSAPVGFLVAGQATSGFSDERPEPNVVAYELDADDGTARWISPGDEPDEWTRQFLGDEYTGAGYEAFPAPRLRDPGDRRLGACGRSAAAQDEGDLRSGTRRKPSGSPADPILAARTEPAPRRGRRRSDRRRYGGGSRGRPRGNPDGLDDDLELLYSAPPSGGVELELELEGDGPVAVELTDISEGLPDIPGSTFDPRPPDMQPLPTQALDPTIVTSTTEID